jgi:hypothetical protein
MYRVLSDFYPSGGTPQLITRTVIVPGDGLVFAAPSLQADLAPKQTENARVELTLSPPRAIAREKVSLSFKVSPMEGIEPYLGSWAHMLAASSDLIDMVHSHPITGVDATRTLKQDIQFDLAFPRSGVYRVWVQFQRLGVVNTVAFDVPVGAAE